MKKTATFLFICFSFLFSPHLTNAQDNPDNPSHFHNPVWLGFNLGGTWETSEVRALSGLGGGITLGKNYLTYTPSKIFIGWRFRFLAGTTYGQDYTKNTGLQNNSAVNGSVDSTTDYYHHGGFIYNNYKMTFNEWSLEVLLGPNLINKRTGSGPLVYVFGGVGLVKSQTFMNLKDANGNRYQYDSIDPTGTLDKNTILNKLATMQNGSYSTLAQGGDPGWKFMPSLGIGIGYQFKNMFQIGAEYKLTFALHDLLDGQEWDNNNNPFGQNDKYNYVGGYLHFGLGGNPRPAGTTGNTDNFNHNPPIDNGNHLPPSGPRPVITITYPGVNSFTTFRNESQLTATIQNVPNPGDISLTVNGTLVTNWNFNTYTGVMHADLRLAPGTNVAIINASNAYGNASASQTFVFTVPDRGMLPPMVNITYPQGNPYNTTVGNISIDATVTNISGPEEIKLTINGMPSSDFTYDMYSKDLRFNAMLGQGNNYFTISAINQVGSDSKTLIVDYTIPITIPPPSPRPVVTIYNPATNPMLTGAPNANVAASVMYVNSRNDIQVRINGNPFQNFSYDNQTNMVQFSMDLVAGNNYIYISGTNASGSDHKNADIVYTPVNNPPVNPTVPPPVVNIINPSPSPYMTNASSVTVTATVLNVSSANDIHLSINGAGSSYFSFIPSTHLLVFTTPVLAGNNYFAITGTNSAGSDSKNLTVVYTPVVVNDAPRPPVVTILNPPVSVFNSGYPNISVDVSVRNITNHSDIQLTINGVGTTNFGFNPSTHDMQFNTPLNNGSNQINVVATNKDGTDSKSVTIIYTPIQVVPKPVVTINYPASNPYTSPTSSMGVTATVLNVNSQADIQVMYNNTPFSGFSYNPMSKMLSVGLNGISGTNSLTITATNSSGSDSKTQTIMYTPPPPTGPPPVITITNPPGGSITTADPNYTVTAIVMNVNGNNQITVSNNSNPVPFNFDPYSHQLSIQGQANVGNNTFLIRANNAFGTDSKSATVILSQPNLSRGGGIHNTGPDTGPSGGPGNGNNNQTNTNGGPGNNLPPPAVTIISPGGNPFVTATPQVSVSAAVQGVTSSNQISVTINGGPYSGFNFNRMSGQVNFTANLNQGNNTIQITVSNGFGTSSKSLAVQYNVSRAPSNPGPGPGGNKPGNKAPGVIQPPPGRPR